MTSFSMGDYVDVKQRLLEFYKKYPDGSIQFEFKGILESNPDMIWGIAYAYRNAEDARPGIGTASELAIGRTSFTKGSELMNLETSAWGRAIGALGIGLGKSVASRQEVEAAQARQEPDVDPWGAPAQPELSLQKARGDGHKDMTEKQYAMIKSLFNYSFQAMTAYVDEFKIANGLSPEQKLSSFWASQLIQKLKDEGYIAGKKPNNPDPESVAT